MNKKLRRLMQPNLALFFVVMALFCAAAVALQEYILAVAEGCATLLLLGCYQWLSVRRRRALADYVQAKGAVFCPHTWSNGVGLLANLHMACAVSDAEYLEYPFDPPVWTVDRRDYIIREEDRVLVDQDGYMHVPQKPGLGFEPDAEALKEYEIRDFYVGE